MVRLTPFTWPFNLSRQPAASVPCGSLAAGYLPVGLQVVGAAFREDLVPVGEPGGRTDGRRRRWPGVEVSNRA